MTHLRTTKVANQLFCTIFFCGVLVAPFAQTWEDLFERTEIPVEAMREYEDGSVDFQLTPPDQEYEVMLQVSSHLVAAEQREIIGEFAEVLQSFRMVTPERVTFYFKDNMNEMSVELGSILSQGEELARTIPSGMYFFRNNDEDVVYSFRMLVETQVLRIYGLYVDEETLIRRIRSAWEDPKTFVRGQDPEFVLALLERIEDRIFALEDRIESVYTTVFRSDGGILDRGEALSGQVAAHQERLESYEELSESLELLREGSAALFGSVGMLLRVDPLDRNVVARIQDYKKAHPQADFQSLYTTLRAEGIRISKKELRAILGTHFGATGE